MLRRRDIGAGHAGADDAGPLRARGGDGHGRAAGRRRLRRPVRGQGAAGRTATRRHRHGWRPPHAASSATTAPSAPPSRRSACPSRRRSVPASPGGGGRWRPASAGSCASRSVVTRRRRQGGAAVRVRRVRPPGAARAAAGRRGGPACPPSSTEHHRPGGDAATIGRGPRGAAHLRPGPPRRAHPRRRRPVVHDRVRSRLAAHRVDDPAGRPVAGRRRARDAGPVPGHGRRPRDRGGAGQDPPRDPLRRPGRPRPGTSTTGRSTPRRCS